MKKESTSRSSRTSQKTEGCLYLLFQNFVLFCFCFIYVQVRWFQVPGYYSSTSCLDLPGTVPGYWIISCLDNLVFSTLSNRYPTTQTAIKYIYTPIHCHHPFIMLFRVSSFVLALFSLDLFSNSNFLSLHLNY
jgi:hypothetical protein